MRPWVQVQAPQKQTKLVKWPCNEHKALSSSPSTKKGKIISVSNNHQWLLKTQKKNIQTLQISRGKQTLYQFIGNISDKKNMLNDISGMYSISKI
jgi:hypothetical protein